MDKLENLHRIDIPKMLKTERKKRGMTYDSLAKKLSCSASYLYRLEAGKRKKPSYEFVAKMINVLGIENLSVYMDKGNLIKSNQNENKEKERNILEYISMMDSNAVKQVNALLQMINEYQSSLQKESN